jgi:hypothetical protein
MASNRQASDLEVTQLHHLLLSRSPGQLHASLSPFCSMFFSGPWNMLHPVFILYVCLFLISHHRQKERKKVQVFV